MWLQTQTAGLILCLFTAMLGTAALASHHVLGAAMAVSRSATALKPTGSIQRARRRPACMVAPRNDDTDATASAGGSTGPPRQAGFAKGASVYDRAHKAETRGYGTITGPGEPSSDGTPTWYVAFERGNHQRIKAIKETYLELSLIQHGLREPLSGLEQPVLFVLGTYKGKTGMTVEKVGGGWTCKVDGQKQLTHASGDCLHATAAPPTGRELKPFDRQLCSQQPLLLAELPDWLLAYQRDPAAPIDLRRKKPASHLWWEVTTGQRTINSLSDDEVLRLHYEAPGRGADRDEGGVVDECSGSGGNKEAGADISSIREALRRAAGGKWTHKWVCACASQCGCPFALEIKHDGAGRVTIWQTEAHEFHDPSSAADLSQLKLDPELEGWAFTLFAAGLKPAQVWLVLLERARTNPALAGTFSHTNSRVCPNPAQLAALRKRWQRDCGFGLTSDPVALAALVAELEPAGVVGFYQPYRAPEKEGGAGQPLVIIIQTPFQKHMLAQFGGRLVFLDATGGTNKYGMLLYALLVQDESGCGVPVGFMICSSDTADKVELFLRTLLKGAREVGDSSFKYGYIMIDKAQVEIAAVKELVHTGDARGWLLCYFHFLQDWERFISSAESGVGSKEARHQLMVSLAGLAHVKDQGVFDCQLISWCTGNQAYPKVVARMKAAWVDCASHWAWWGRLDILDLCANTNNLAERSFGLLKYTDLNRDAQSTIHRLVCVLLEKTVPRYMHMRGLRLAGRVLSDQRRAEQRAAAVADSLAAGGKVQLLASGPPGLTLVDGEKVCMGDLSCTCSYAAENVCWHIRAAAQVTPFTGNLRAAAAAHLVANSTHILVGDDGLCSVGSLASLSRAVYFRPRDAFCICNDYVLNRTCCHLLASAQLPSFAGEDLPMHTQQAEDSGDEPIPVHSLRTFQQPTTEPLGADEGYGELAAITAARERGVEAVRRTLSNADPMVAEARAACATIQRTIQGLQGEEREEAMGMLLELRDKMAAMAEAAQLPLTEQRAGKQQRRQQQRKTTALFPGRKRGHTTLAQELQQEAPAQAVEASDPFPGRNNKKARAEKKMRGPTVPGNVDGTVLRGGPHHRIPVGVKRAAQRAASQMEALRAALE